MIPPELEARVQAWLAADPDAADRAELVRLLEGDAAAHAELAARFDGHLRFGTSGLRAPLGAGPRRMNRLVVRQVAAGLVRWLDGQASAGEQGGSSGAPPPGGPRILIGHDARHRSTTFAADLADVVAARGGTPLRLDVAVPTPVAVWAAGALDADATVVCTASHNPPTDNGCKIYLGDGAQPLPPDDVALAATIAAVADAGDLPPVGTPPGPIDAVEVIEGYVAHVAGLVGPPPSRTRLVHTALHGVGWPVLRQVFAAAGYDEPIPVAAQADPDPDFPTTPFPNPEEAGALDAAATLAAEVGAVAVLANDPDADRLGLAVPAAPALVAALGAPAGLGASGWVRLSGDQLGWLLADHLLTRGEGGQRLVVSTFETSRLLSRLAEHHGVVHVEVPTGFKWIAHAAMARPELAFVFGYEEALGYSVDGTIRDKDGIATALVAAELLADAHAEGATVWDRLEAVARRVGHHATATRFWRADAAQRPAIDAALARLRAAPPAAVAGREVVEVVDLATGALGHPADAVVLHLAGDARVVARPSGTEPKLKVYGEQVDALDDAPDAFARAEAAGRAEAAALADALLGWLRQGGDASG